MTIAATRVLLLEDTDSDRLVVEEALRTAPGQTFELEHMDHVAHIVERLGVGPAPDLVLIDLCVHDSQGIDTFRRVRAAAEDLPIVVQSGLSDEQLGVTAVREGAQDYLVKGRFTGEGLLRTIRHARERHEVELALRVSEERYSLAVQGANDGVWDWDLASGRVFFAPRFTEMLGYGVGELGDSPELWFASVHPEDVDGLTSVIAAHTFGADGHFEHEHRIRHQDGSWRWVFCRGTAVRDEGGCAFRMAGSISDVTVRKQAEARLLHDAFHDRLTGLANRALCLDRIGQAMRRVSRTEDCIAVLFIDLDRFKLVNDSLGHAAGDHLLLGIADRLRSVVRPADTIARLGGDEFCVVLESIHTPEDANLVANRTRAALAPPFELGGQQVFVTASIGIAVHDESHRTPDDLVRAADLAMYKAKSSGRDCHHVFDAEMQHRAVTRLELETDLRTALEREEFLLHYQPIMNLEDGEMHGVEALIRWNSLSRGLVSPLSFIPLAEETGLIVPIGAWVLAEATRRMAEWDADSNGRPPPLDLSVNISPKQFFAADIVRTIGDALDRTGLPPERLILEITETVLVENHHIVSRALHALKELGVRIHLDDFGTGFSSLSYLQRLPIDCIKIDRSFVRGIATKAKDLEIVRAIVGLGHGLGKTVVAEGIETDGQLQRLRGLDCDFGQGFLFSRPVDSWATLPLCA